MGNSNNNYINTSESEAFFRQLAYLILVPAPLLPDPKTKTQFIFDEIDEKFNERLFKEGRELLASMQNSPAIPLVFETKSDFLSHKTFLAGEKSEESHVVTRSLCEETVNIDSELLLFFTVNRIDPEGIVDCFEIIDRRETDNEIRMVYLLRTKKVGLVQPRENFMYRIIRRSEDGKIFDLQTSLHLIGLKDHPQIEEKYRETPNAVADAHYLFEYEPLGEGKVKRSFFVIANTKSSVGFMILKPLMVSSMKKRINGMEKAIEGYFSSDEWRNKEKGVWFGGNLEAIEEKVRKFLKKD